MNWDAIGAIAELLGAIGVIASLVYLAVQLRHNTQALRVTSQQHVATVGSRFLDGLRRDDMGRTYALGLRAYPHMTADEKRSFVYAFTDYLNALQEAFAFYEGGVLDSEVYSATLSAVQGHLRTPGGAALWAELRGYLPPGIVEELESAGDLPDVLQGPYFPLDDPPSSAAVNNEQNPSST